MKGILPATENPALCPVAAVKAWRQLLRLHGLAIAGTEERSIAEQSGHRSMTILRRYIRDGNVLHGNALRKLGL